MAGQEAGGSRLLADDVEDIIAVKVPGFPQESLFAVVVIRRVKAELPGTAAVGERRVGRGDVPAGKGPGAGFDIVLGVVELLVFAHAEGKEFQEFPAVVFVQSRLVALGVVQVIDHGRAGGEEVEEVAEVAHAVVAEHLDHAPHFLAGVDFAVAGAENHVPEQGHFLLELAGVVDHAIDPGLDVGLDGRRLVVGGLVAHEQIFLDAGAGLGGEQFGDDGVVPPGGLGFDLVAAGAEAGPPQQVSHQCDILVSHKILLLMVGSARRPGDIPYRRQAGLKLPGLLATALPECREKPVVCSQL